MKLLIVLSLLSSSCITTIATCAMWCHKSGQRMSRYSDRDGCECEPWREGQKATSAPVKGHNI